MARIEIDTPSGAARADLDRPGGAPRGLLAAGHGAGGGVDAPDLVAARDAALAAGWAVARVTQPYRVAGGKVPARAPRLDEAWLAVVERLRDELGPLPLVAAGRSSGARVACRTAAAAGAAGVACLAFPLRPPWRPEQTRLAELDAVPVPVLVVQGDRDPFGMPPRCPGRRIVAIAGADHSLRADPGAVADAVTAFLAEVAPAG
ncbi:MAG: alpha/beta family hydrolase [Thermoleophilia bacterium]